MRWRDRGVNLSRYWPFWGLNFGIHIIMGLLVSIAGLVVVFTMGEVINGLALIGAGAFSLLNGWQGCKELAKSKVNRLYQNSK